MRINKKLSWKNPSVHTLQNEQIKENIIVSACSNYFEACFPSNQYIDSIPGFPPVIM